MKPIIRTVVTDLDNTLFDWVEMWGASFTALLDGIIAKSGLSREVLLPEIRAVHQQYHTAEYAFLVQALPSLQRLHPYEDLTVVYSDAILAFKNARKDTLRLFPGVVETLRAIKATGCQIIGYTESQAFYSSYRIRALGLDGVLDALYSPADHDTPADFTRSKPADAYGLLITRHAHTPAGELKPNPHILAQILSDAGALQESTIYLGDSLMKDVAMAKDAGVFDVHAKYGVATHREVYDLLRQVTHWSDADVEREREMLKRGTVVPTCTLHSSITELFNVFTFASPEAPLTRKERVTVAVELWKKTVEVQQHFNDLSLRIRNLAITVLGAVFSVAGLILKDSRESHLPWQVVMAGFALCAAFYFMDYWWYHRLLKGSVDGAIPLEKMIESEGGVPLKLGRGISDASVVHVPIWYGKRYKARSRTKLNVFWAVLLGVTLLFAFKLRDVADDAKAARLNQEALTAAARQDSVARSAVTLTVDASDARRAAQPLGDSTRRAPATGRAPLRP